MKEKKLITKTLGKICTLLLWSAFGVVLVAGLPVIFKDLKVNWYTVSTAIGVPAATLLWEWANKQIGSVAKTAEENRNQIAAKFEALNNMIDRLAIQQQADESIREQLIEVRVELERLKSDIGVSERLIFLEQIIHRFVDNEKKNINH